MVGDMTLRPGSTATLRRVFSQQDFDRFAALSGDDNPIHVDPAFAARTRFGRTVAHGMLLYSVICAALAEEAGAGFEQLEQELMFLTPTYTGEEVTVRLEAASVDEAGGTAEIATHVLRPEGATACQGRTVIALAGATRRTAAASTPYETSAGEHKGLRLGQTARTVRTFTMDDLREYRDLSGDPHPTDRVPGGLLGGLFSYLLGTKLPGRGTNWLKQRMVYLEPCFAGEEITATVEITRLRPEKDLVNLRGACVARGRVVSEGESLVLVKDLEHGDAAREGAETASHA
jgi:acyl dehydratase